MLEPAHPSAAFGSRLCNGAVGVSGFGEEGLELRNRCFTDQQALV